MIHEDYNVNWVDCIEIINEQLISIEPTHLMKQVS